MHAEIKDGNENSMTRMDEFPLTGFIKDSENKNEKKSEK
jgi:hypothetical protein